MLYQINLINHIEQEFDYNVAQQIYISEELWQIIVQSKNSIIELIHQIGNNPNIIDASQLRQTLIAKNIIIEEKLEIARKAIKLEVNTITDK
ncbi:hypothetical protein [Myroides odoratimimus]|uniref:DUF7935 family protein n=1 Tax=Myroides odoratimimus TaxID=76832 RepID=UPI000A69F7AC|nr:hypothetical protein [Myroides odoratimimus]